MADVSDGRADIDDVIQAIEDGSPTMPYFLDRATGEVMLVADALGFIDAERQRLAMAAEPGRHVAIPALGDSGRIGVMEAFIDTLDDEDLAERLETALERDAVRRFAAEIEGSPDEARRWVAFRAADLRTRAETWVAENGQRPDRRVM